MRTRHFVFAAMATLLIASSAQASVEINGNPTKNMNCSGGLCSPTAKSAVLNTTDLANMLATEDVKVITGNGAVTITVSGPFSWTSTHRLTLDANVSVSFRAPVEVTGQGAVTIVTNDGGTGGDLHFFSGGKLDFEDTHDDLTINGHSFSLAASVPALITAVKRSKYNGFIALAKDTDALVDGAGRVKQPFAGVFEGLGHTIANLNLTGDLAHGHIYKCLGLFDRLNAPAVVRDIKLKNIQVSDYHGVAFDGTLVGCNYGASILYASAQGSLVAQDYGGGLVGENLGVISQSFALVDVQGAVSGGLVAYDDVAQTIDSYAMGSVYGGQTGGLIGRALYTDVTRSYSTGAVSGKKSAELGGLIGDNYNDESGGANSNAYWDLDTSGIVNPSQGAGSPANDPGITGLTDVELKAALPTGFDPAIWAQNPDINNGYPYLLANPPQP